MAHGIVIPTRWRTQPAGTFELDPGHPLAQSIAFFCVNVNGRFYDLVQNQIGAANGSAKIAAYAGRGANQAAALASATSDYYSFATNSAYNITGDLSLLWSGTIATGSGYRSFAFKGSGNGSTNCPFDFRTDNSATPKIAALRSNATTTTLNLATSVTISLGVSHQVGASLPVGGGLQVVYLDGASAASSSVGLYTVTSNSNAMLVGRRADGAVQMNGNTEFVIGWSSALTSGAFAELWAAPYQMMRPRQRRLYFGAAAATHLRLAPVIVQQAVNRASTF